MDGTLNGLTSLPQPISRPGDFKLVPDHGRQAADAAVGCPDGVPCDPPPDDRIARVMHALDAFGLSERQILAE